MSTTTIQLNTGHDDFCKRLKDPQNDAVFHLEALLPFRQAVKLDRGNANVRPAAETKPLRDMLETVENNPQTFHLKNRGITYLCDKFELDNSKKIVTVTIPKLTQEEIDEDDIDIARFGIADGGHTYEVIRRTVEAMDEHEKTDGWREPYVRVRFISGHTADLAPAEDIVWALNSSLQVKAFTLDEYEGKFQELKAALTKTGFDVNLIAFRENEPDKEWHVLEVIQRLACFLKDRWGRTQPASMYKSKAKALELYTSDSTRGEFRKLFDVITDVVTLPEYIESQLSTGGLVEKRSLGKLKAVKVLKREERRPGTDYPRGHKLDLAALLPMAAAFRELLGTRDDRYYWKVDPKEVFQRCAKDLYEVLVARSRKVKAVSHLGSDMEYWHACVPIVMRTKDIILEEMASVS